MKFVSKNANYLAVLRPSVPGEPMAGRSPKPGLSVRFEEGSVEVVDEKICEKLMQHRGFDVDFFLVEVDAKDPFAEQRQESEPAHTLTGLKYGTPEKSTSSPRKIKLPPELSDYISQSINEGVKEGMAKLIPDLVKQLSEAATKKTGKKKTKVKTKKTPKVEEAPVVSEDKTEEVA